MPTKSEKIIAKISGILDFNYNTFYSMVFSLYKFGLYEFLNYVLILNFSKNNFKSNMEIEKCVTKNNFILELD